MNLFNIPAVRFLALPLLGIVGGCIIIIIDSGFVSGLYIKHPHLLGNLLIASGTLLWIWHYFRHYKKEPENDLNTVISVAFRLIMGTGLASLHWVIVTATR